MADAPGSPGTCATCKSSCVIGCQSSFWAQAGTMKTAVRANNRTTRTRFTVSTSVLYGEICCRLYIKKGNLTRVSEAQFLQTPDHKENRLTLAGSRRMTISVSTLAVAAPAWQVPQVRFCWA